MKRIIVVSSMDLGNNSAGSKRVKSYSLALLSVVNELYLISFYSEIKSHTFTFKNINNTLFSSFNDEKRKRNIKNFWTFFRKILAHKKNFGARRTPTCRNFGQIGYQKFRFFGLKSAIFDSYKPIEPKNELDF